MNLISFIGAVAFLFAATSTIASANLHSLPSGFVGTWHGYPSYAVIGPGMRGSDGMRFAIHSTSPNSWLMEDTLLTGGIATSAQQFWVTSPNATNGTNIYCGWLQDFYK